VEYIKYKPHGALRNQIDFYWLLQTDAIYQPVRVPLFADACADIFVNMGSTLANFNGHTDLLPGRIYLGGTSTTAGFLQSFPDSLFMGVRFKPGGLHFFYHLPLFEIVDRIIEFQDNHFLSIIDPDEKLPDRLDQFFLSKQSKNNLIQPVVDTVYHHKGLISVDTLTQKCNITTRSLERLVNLTIGTTPKEFINIVRFQQSLNMLKQKRVNGQLKHIALKMGYYDQAHFIRDVKKHAGLNPSEIGPGPRFP